MLHVPQHPLHPAGALGPSILATAIVRDADLEVHCNQRNQWQPKGISCGANSEWDSQLLWLTYGLHPHAPDGSLQSCPAQHI